ncbi:MAG: HNH endonuclease signature motif containing protein, partial [Acidimicrobiales bacterium]
VLVDAIALKRGYATASETCEIPGFGPVDVNWVSRILPDSMIDVLVHDLVDIQAHATLTRHRRKALDQALRARDRRCVVAGCRRKRMLQADHRHDFAQHGPTSAANLERLCQIHHREKTHRGARIERVDDEWHWYPPPPAPGEPHPPPGSIPWRSPVGEHLTAFDLTDLPEPSGTLPFGAT